MLFTLFSNAISYIGYEAGRQVHSFIKAHVVIRRSLTEGGLVDVWRGRQFATASSLIPSEYSYLIAQLFLHGFEVIPKNTTKGSLNSLKRTFQNHLRREPLEP